MVDLWDEQYKSIICPLWERTRVKEFKNELTEIALYDVPSVLIKSSLKAVDPLALKGSVSKRAVSISSTEKGLLSNYRYSSDKVGKPFGIYGCASFVSSVWIRFK